MLSAGFLFSLYFNAEVGGMCYTVLQPKRSYSPLLRTSWSTQILDCSLFISWLFIVILSWTLNVMFHVFLWIWLVSLICCAAFKWNLNSPPCREGRSSSEERAAINASLGVQVCSVEFSVHFKINFKVEVVWCIDYSNYSFSVGLLACAVLIPNWK
jgi:hypothetical protein